MIFRWIDILIYQLLKQKVNPELLWLVAVFFNRLYGGKYQWQLSRSVFLY